MRVQWGWMLVLLAACGAVLVAPALTTLVT
jgi:hypothetical protein